jgi:hypothetical protein
MPEGHHPPLSRSSNVEQPRIVGLPLRLETRHRSPLHRPLGPRDIARISPGPGEAGRPAATMDPGSLFSVERPSEGAAEGGSQLRSKNPERAKPSRVHAANVSPAEGEGGTLERRSGVVSKKPLQGTRVAGLQGVFRVSPLYSHSPENVSGSRRNHQGGPDRPAARAYR